MPLGRVGWVESWVERSGEATAGKQGTAQGRRVDSPKTPSSSARGPAVDFKSRLDPSVYTSDHVGSVLEADLAQLCSSEAGRIALAADQQHPGVECQLRVACRFVRVEAPEDDRKRVMDSFCEVALTVTFILGADVHEHGAILDLGERFFGRDTL